MKKPETRVDADFFNGLQSFAIAAHEADVPWLIVGATARVLLLEKVYAWPAGLATQDTDFAVQVGSWAHYAALSESLLRQPGTDAGRKPAKRFRVGQDLHFDLIPYGGVEENNRQVFWPPDRDYLMTVRGFAGAARDAIIIRVNDELDVPVVSPPGLCALKLFAWEERYAQEVGRDAKDIAYLFKNIERWLPHEQLFEKGMNELEEADYDAQLATLDLFGQQTAALLESDERDFMTEMLAKDLEQEWDGPLMRDLLNYLQLDNKQKVVDIVTAFLRGVNREAYSSA